MTYDETANELYQRIFKLDHALVVQCVSPFDLFSIGLKVDDLQPSLAQASWALSKAQTAIRGPK